ncbi:MAG: LapA family protein [Alphaproteobacteria bacterium]|nr:LapA family protein [Alphaproteobacteria bacterium]
MRWLIALPFLLLLVLFALSNTSPVRLALWPTDFGLTAPLSVAMLLGMAIAFLLGAGLVWFAELGQRRRARRAEHTVRLLEEQINRLSTREPAAGLTRSVPPPGA